jgi:chromosome partitioning protein
MDQVETFRRVADMLRSAQRAAIEVENAPDRRKRLRTFSTQEVAELLGVAQRDLRLATPRVISAERSAVPRTRLAFTEIQELRAALRGAFGELRLVPHRQPDLGEALATVAFTNFKGGSAKTTSSVHFAQYMALAGYRVLLVDLDSQGSATAQFGIDPATEVGLENSFAAWTSARDTGSEADAGALCQPTYWPAIDIVPAGAALAAAEESLSRRAVSGKAEEPLYFEEIGAFLAAVGTATTSPSWTPAPT